MARRIAAWVVARAAEGWRALLARVGPVARRAAAAAWAHRPPPPQVAAGALVAAIAALSAAAISFQAGLAGRLPSALDWSAAAALVDRDARPGDAVLLSPGWAERARAVLPARVPVLAIPSVQREDLVGVRRVWLLALPDAPGSGSSLEADLLERDSRLDGPERLGALAVTRYELAFPTLALAFLPDRLAAADVTLGGTPCAAEASDALRCGADGAVTVAREIRDVGGVPRVCIVASPRSPDAPLSIAFPEVPMGRAVRLHAAALAGPPAPLRLAVQLDGDEAGAIEIARAGDWRPLQIDTTRHAGRARTLGFVLTPRSSGEAPVCFDAVTLP